jgi:hypothetical protein
LTEPQLALVLKTPEVLNLTHVLTLSTRWDQLKSELGRLAKGANTEHRAGLLVLVATQLGDGLGLQFTKCWTAISRGGPGDASSNGSPIYRCVYIRL